MSDRTKSWNHQEQERREDVATIVATIERQEEKYSSILPTHVSFSEFKNSFLVAVQSNPRLLEADRQSLWLALQKCAGDGLKPDGREAALVIFGDDAEDDEGNPVPSMAKGKKKVVYMPMVWGLTKLVRNSGLVSGIRAQLVYRGERVVVVDEDGKQSYRHERVLDEVGMVDDSPANIVGAYAVVNYKDGTWEMEPMSRRQIDRVRAISRSKKGPWLTWYDEQAKKTVLRRLIKRLDKSAELRRLGAAIDNDETLATTIEGEKPVEIMEAFSDERQAAKPADKTVTKKPSPPPSGGGSSQTAQNSGGGTGGQDDGVFPPPQSDAPADRRVAPSDSPAGSVQPTQERREPEKLPEKLAAQISQVETVEIWAIDEIGEPVDRPEPMDAIEFANWFAAQLFRSKNPDALREHNADNIGDAGGADPKARAVITDAIARAARRSPPGTVPALIDATQPAPVTAKPERQPLPVPKTPKGAPHWANYGAAAKAEIATLIDDPDADDWIRVNEPTYGRKAIQIPIENAIEARRKGFKQAPSSAASDQPAADSVGMAQRFAAPSDDVVSDNSLFLDWVGLSLSTMTTKQQVVDWSESADVRAAFFAVKKRSPATFTQAVGLADERTLELDVSS